MKLNNNIPRLLGFLFVLVIIIGVLSGLPLDNLNYSMTGAPENISETMTSFSAKPEMVQLSITGYLLEASAIVFLSILLFTVLRNQSEHVARWAMGLWILEAAFLAMREISAFCLLFTSQEFTAAGSPVASHFQTMGSLFYKLMHFSYDVQMIFYCVGGFLFYYLFFKSKGVPRGLALYGIIVVSIAFLGEVYAIFGHVVPLYVYLPILPFELGIGLWLIFKGFNQNETTANTM